MNKRTDYLSPQAEVIVVCGRESILNLSGFGDTNEPGSIFTPGGNVIDYPTDF